MPSFWVGVLMVLFAAIAVSICFAIWLQVRSHELPARNESTLVSHDFLRLLFKILSPHFTSSSAVRAICTSLLSPYGETTSLIGVDITGMPAAKYSGVFVGEINFVDSFIANGIIATSQPDKYC